MELTEKRRLEREAAGRIADPKPKFKAPKIEPAPQIVEKKDTLAPELPVTKVQEEKALAIKNNINIPVNAIARSLVYILTLIAFLMAFSKLSDLLATKLNTLIIYGSFFVLNIIQVPCIVDGFFLNTSYYSISLKDDLIAFYSLELLIIFTLLFAYFQRITRIKRGVVFIILVPLAVVANIFRVVMAFGLALNDGPADANRYLHGGLVGLVFVIIILGLIFLELLSSPE